VKAKKFRIWGVKNIEEGIEILTGIPPGQRGKDEKYPEGTVNFLVEKRLKEFGEALKEAPPSKENEEKKAVAREAKKEPPKPPAPPRKTPIQKRAGRLRERRQLSKTKRQRR
jgi:hypothetical protein